MDTLIPQIILFFIFAGSAYYVLAPLMASPVLAVDDALDTRTNALELRKISLYKQIREAEFEHEMGLTDLADYERTREDLMNETAEVLQAIEGPPAKGKKGGAKGSGAKPPPPAIKVDCPNCGETATSGTLFCAACGTELGKACPQCGTQTTAGARFCGECGRGLVE